MRARLLLVATLLASPSKSAAALATGSLSGQVVDQAKRPIPNASVSIVELHRAALTDRAGNYRIADVPAGRYTISARRIGFATQATVIIVGEGTATASFSLAASALRLEPVNISASRAPSGALGSPLATSVLTDDEVDRDGGVSLAHSLARLPGVRDVSTGQQVGKPMIRGLFGPRVLVLADGSRLEDYSWSDEDGPSIDARIADRIEVIRGPASMLYGSEALSGAVNVIPADLSYSADGSRQQRRAMEAYVASGNLELGSALMLEGAQSRYAWRFTGTGRASQNYGTPTGEVQNSSFWGVNGEGAFGIRGDHGSTTIRAAHYGGEFHILEASGPEAGDAEGGPVRQTLDDRLQVSNDHLLGGFRLETKAQWQRHGLTEVSDDCVPPVGQTTCTKVKDKVAFDLALNTGTVDVLLHQPRAGHLDGTIGVSGMAQFSSSTGPIFIVPGASGNAAGAFAFEQLSYDKFSLVAGARADTRHLSSHAQPEISRAADARSWNAFSGEVGMVFQPLDHFSIVLNTGTGWRAPTLFDLYANGPNLAEARFEIGDPKLAAERSHESDVGARWTSDHVRAEATIFRNDVRHFIFTTPTAAQQGGLQIFRHTQADAQLIGGELAVEARATDELTLHASHDVVRGTEIANDSPLPLMPPPRTILGAAYSLGQLGSFNDVHVGGNVEIDQKQTRLNPEDLSTEGYTLLNLDFAAEHAVRSNPVRFDLLVHNALNTTYRDYLSRFKGFANAPGVNVIVKASFGAW